MFQFNGENDENFNTSNRFSDANFEKPDYVDLNRVLNLFINFCVLHHGEIVQNKYLLQKIQIIQSD